MVDLDVLWQPLEVGTTTLKNRVMTSAHSLAYSKDHILSDRHIAYYRERAMGGLALLISEQHAAHQLSLGSFYNCITAWEERCIPQMERLAETIHEHDCAMFIELAIMGVQDKGHMFSPWHPLWGVSRVPSVIHNEIPHVVGKREIRSLVEGYVQSVRNVKRSGLDGVELHGAHSYGIAQFLSPFYNRRTDEYGGSVRNRCRFAIEVADAVRQAVGDFTMGIRLSFDEFAGEAGITGEQSEEILDILAETGHFDFFDLSGGNYHNLHLAVAPMSVPDGFMIPFGRRAKEVVGDRAKVFIVGRIRHIDMAADIVANSWADMVCMTRAHITDPALVRKAQEGRKHETHICVGANECILRNFQQRDIFCMVNPVTGREAEWGEGSLQVVAGERSKKVVVVGGGPAGMKSAAVAGRRGHEVVLFERSDELGGHINLIKHLPTRTAWQDAIDNLLTEMRTGGVEVRTGVDVTRELLDGEAPDAVVCATGSTWDCTGFSVTRTDRDELPGVDQDNVLDVGTAIVAALEDPAALGSSVLIVDDTGEYLPLGLAELLADNGASVEVVCPRAVVGENVAGALEGSHIYPRLEGKGVRLTANAFVESVSGNEAEVYSVWGGWRRTEAVDTVVLSLLRTPNDELFREIEGAYPAVHQVGDAVAPRRTIIAIYEGEKAGREI